jgi:DNA topoisomerase VI subunit B
MATFPDRFGQFLPDFRQFVVTARGKLRLGEIVPKELVDNALDAGANVSLGHDGDTWIVSDDGPGLDPVDVPRLFSVNRALLSSKLKRLPLRGMLGNGPRVVVGAVVANEGMLVVETHGRRMTWLLPARRATRTWC